QPAACPTPPPTSATFNVIRSLAGTWESIEPGPDQKPMVVIFKPTSMDSAVVESMFPGSPHEMINLFTSDGDGVVMTHYCAMGNQPRMRAASADDGVLKFQFV